LPREQPGGCLLTGQAGVRHGWWRERGLGSRAELGNLSPRWGGRPVEQHCPAAGRLEREPQAAGTARGRVVMRGTGADRPVVAVKAL
jgi:hypothetical protein